MPKVQIYTADHCPYCQSAKKLLKSKNVDFQEIDVTGDLDLRRKLVELAGGRETVPQIFADGQLIGGYDDLVAFYRSGKSL